ncbi:hypothetical protein DN068_10105 [Taibaiella soli]|uniref:Uncharacterized protein n=1 Tax=Taibaiella soli TaxID=1649169 RepID=A0A2W2BZD9_9BACT|nr:hypothetical protein DN068_10105 [Taibaiella soli]
MAWHLAGLGMQNRHSHHREQGSPDIGCPKYCHSKALLQKCVWHSFLWRKKAPVKTG